MGYAYVTYPDGAGRSHGTCGQSERLRFGLKTVLEGIPSVITAKHIQHFETRVKKTGL